MFLVRLIRRDFSDHFNQVAQPEKKYESFFYPLIFQGKGWEPHSNNTQWLNAAIYKVYWIRSTLQRKSHSLQFTRVQLYCQYNDLCSRTRNYVKRLPLSFADSTTISDHYSKTGTYQQSQIFFALQGLPQLQNGAAKYNRRPSKISINLVYNVGKAQLSTNVTLPHLHWPHAWWYGAFYLPTLFVSTILWCWRSLELNSGGR